jgi:hypothetical protein
MSMYNKIALFSALLCVVKLHASDISPWLEIKPSYFFFSSCPLKNIFHHGGFEIQGSASVPVCDHLALYGSVGWRRVTGHTLSTREKTKLTVIPLDIGLKTIVNFCERFYYFFAIGPRYFHFRQHNYSPYVDCTINGNGIGLFINSGFNVLFSDCLLLGIFGEYSYEKKKICPKKPNVFSNGSVQLGGIAVGLSLGYAF